METYDLTKITVKTVGGEDASASESSANSSESKSTTTIATASNTNTGRYQKYVKRDYVTNPLSQEEVIEQLKNYILVPEDQWEHMGSATHIRYIDINNCFRPGGWFQRQYVTSLGKVYFVMESKPNGYTGQPGYFSWRVLKSNIKLLYKKATGASGIDPVEINLIKRELATKRDEIKGIRDELFNESDRAAEIQDEVSAVKDSFKTMEERVLALEQALAATNSQLEKLKLFVFKTSEMSSSARK